MLDSAAGYSGVVYTEVDAGYTSAEGYTGVVRSTVASGYTGTVSAPVTTSGTAAAASAAAAPAGRSEVDPILVTSSPYDASVVPRGDEPGTDVATDLRDRAPAVIVDDARLLEEEEPPPSPPDAPADLGPYADRRVDALSAFARSLVGLEDQLQLSPQPPPNRALQEARRVLKVGIGPLPGRPRALEVLGSLADLLDQQIAEALAQTKPTTLGEAYVQGIFQEVASTVVHGAAGTAAFVVDPVGTAVTVATGTVDEIRGRMAAGEGFWEAVNSTLNPALRLLTEGARANDIAGEALEAARRGDWEEAVRLSRESGRSAARAGVAAAETVLVARDVVDTGTALRRRLAARAGPAPGPAPPRPPDAPRPPGLPDLPVARTEVEPLRVVPDSASRLDGVTGTVVRDGVAGPQLPAPRVSQPHPRFPQVPVPDADVLRKEIALREALLRRQAADAANALADLPADQRRDAGQRLAIAKPIYNSREWLSAADLQLAHPDRAYLTQVELRSVETAAGSVPARQITAAIAPKRPGRILDVLELRPDGRFGDLELKTESAILRAYGGRFDPARGWRFPTRGPRGGVEIQGFVPSNVLSRELAKTKRVFDFARQNNGRVRVRGVTLDGRIVELDLDPAGFTGTTPARYGEVQN